MPDIAPDALERWMYRKDGMDYGPFMAREVEHMLESAELTGDSEVYQRRQKRWIRVRDVPHFREFLARLEHKRAEEAHRQEVQRDHAQMERHTAVRHRAPLVLGGVAAVALAVGAFFLLRPPPPVLAGYPATFFRDLSFERLTPVAAVLAAPVRTAPATPDTAPSPAAAKAPRAGRRAAPAAAAAPILPGNGDYHANLQVDLSFDAEDASGGRKLETADIDALQSKVTPGLIRCFRAESQRFDAFEGGSVYLYVMSKGTVQLSRLSTTPGPSSELVGCVRGVTAGQRVPPFAGGAQVMEIPLRVAGVR